MNKGREGFTLLEAVLSLAIGVLAAAFAAQFLAGQLSLYNRYRKMREACMEAERVCAFLEESICMGFDFFVNPDCPEKLYFWEMDEEGRRAQVLEADDMRNVSPAWDVRLEFFDPAYGRVCARVGVYAEDRLVYREERTFISLYEEE